MPRFESDTPPPHAVQDVIDEEIYTDEHFANIALDYLSYTRDSLHDLGGLSEDLTESYLVSTGKLIDELKYFGDEDTLNTLAKVYTTLSDPYAAYEAVETFCLADTSYAANLLMTMHDVPSEFSAKIINFEAEKVSTFIKAKDILSDFADKEGLIAESWSYLAFNMRDTFDYGQYIFDLKTLLTYMPTLNLTDQQPIFDKLQSVADPSDVRDAWTTLHDEWTTIRDLPQVLQDKLYEQSTTGPLARIRAINSIKGVDILKERGIDFDLIDPDTFLESAKGVLKSYYGYDRETDEELSAKVPYKPSTPIVSTIRDKYKAYYNLNEDERSAESKTPELEQFPYVAETLLGLGIDEQLAASMFRSWVSFDGLGKHDRRGDRPSHGEISGAAIMLSKWIEKQQKAVQEFANKYGSEELAGIIDIFNIHNFARCRLLLLHLQISAWHDGDKPVKNASAISHFDWNHAFKNAGYEQSNLFDGFAPYFEVKSSEEIARTAIKIGQHELDNGRVPDLDNFVIGSHAGPAGMKMNNHLNLTVAGIDQAVKRALALRNNNGINLRPNNFRKHLGNNCRIIVVGCEAAGDNGNGMNITESISEAHLIDTVGAPVATSREIILSENGDVSYHTNDGEKIKGKTYQGSKKIWIPAEVLQYS